MAWNGHTTLRSHRHLVKSRYPIPIRHTPASCLQHARSRSWISIPLGAAARFLSSLARAAIPEEAVYDYILNEDRTLLSGCANLRMPECALATLLREIQPGSDG